MNLIEIKGTASKFATTISKILDVNAIIIDNDYQLIANTFNVDLVTRYSILGDVMQTGKVIVVDDKLTYDNCRNCPDLDTCVISGFIGVPIFFENNVIGAIALLVPDTTISSVFTNLQTSVDFLERMADLLSSKLKNIHDNKKLNVKNKEREIIIDMIDEALVFVNNTGQVMYYNNKFDNIFEIDQNIIGNDITQVLDHPLINRTILFRKDISYKKFYYELKNIRFYGFVSYRNIMINGIDYGGLFTFKSASYVYNAFNKVLDSKTKIDFNNIINNDPYMVNVIDKVKHIAVTDENILICSKPGLGKSTLARAIHNFSDRSKQYFAFVDCKSAPINILEDEIFGCESITNASPNIGKLRIANKGTIFFKNISDMPMNLQKRLVEVMKTKELKVSSYNDFNINVRMIFDTCDDLDFLVNNGMFNEELYYRISRNTVNIPPLSTRKDDIKIIVNNTINKIKKRFLKESIKIDEGVLELMYQYDWPNNIREIEKVVELIIYNSKNNKVILEDISNYEFVSKNNMKLKTLEEMEKELIEKMLFKYDNKDVIAAKLNIGRATLYRKLNKYGLNGQS